jgi:hypothetical protein
MFFVKNIRILLVCYCLVIFAILAAIFHKFGNPLVFVMSLVVAYASYFLIVPIYSSIMKKLIAKSIDCLDNKCDPYAYLSITNDILSSASKKSHCSLKINKTIGLLAAGLFDEALALLESMDVREFNTEAKVIYLMELSNAYYSKSNIEKAEQLLKDCQSLIDTSEIRSESNEVLEASIQYIRHCFKVLKNELDGCEEFFTNRFEKAIHTRQRVGAKVNLGALYLKQNRKSEALAAYQYVADNGNRLFVAEKAREFLKQVV